MIGTTLGRYRIVAKLGEGGMGSVWRAEDPALGRTVALKLLAPVLLGSDAARQRFLREARSASGLRHPNIATVFDVGESEGGVWIACEFVDGESVAARCAAGPLPIADAVTVARETAAALAHAHERGVLHRDVTAGNVMVTRDGHAVLVDFGLARHEAATQLTSTGALLGTVGYVAPELLSGAEADARGDLYGLGSVLYWMLTGRLPYQGGPPEAMLYRALNEPVPPPSELRPDVSPALERVVLKLLERVPEDRYASATEAEAALAEAATAAGPSAAELKKRAAAKRLREWSSQLRRLARVRVGVAGLVGVALLTVTTRYAVNRGWLPGLGKPKVIAVLPFLNSSEEVVETAYLVDGLGGELSSRLGLGRRYRVLPWATTRRYRDDPRQIRDIALELRADMLLTGSFRTEGERLRVTTSLVDGHTGLQRWSRTFDQTITDLMSIQTNIALEVAARVQGSLARDERSALTRLPSSSPEAYDHYLRGVGYLLSDDFTLRGFALPFFERAIELDSTLAAAWVGRGAAIQDLYFRGTRVGIHELEDAERDFRHALALDPALLEAQSGLVSTAFERGEFAAALEVASTVARRGDSDVRGLITRGKACMFTGLHETAMALFDRVLQLDADNQEAAWFRVITLAWAGRMLECEEAGRHYLRRFGEDPEILTWMFSAAASLAHDQDAELYRDRAARLFGDESSNFYLNILSAYYFLERGKPERAQRLFDHWIPILRSRLDAAPGNYRVWGFLTALESLSGNRKATRQRLDEYLTDLRSHQRGAGPELPWALQATISVGDTASARRLLQTARATDLSNLVRMTEDWFGVRAGLARGAAAGDATKEQESLLTAIRARVGELRTKYEPVVGLHQSSAPRRVADRTVSRR